MKNPFSSKKADVISHWYALVPDFQSSTQEFYASVEKELEARKVPDLEISRVEFAEGGLLSAKREYLRMTRERLVFDICAAPFGTSYFYSLRFAELPSVVKLWQIVLFLFLLGISLVIILQLFGGFFGWLVFFLLIGLGIYSGRNAASMGIDAALIKTPVIGPIYERFFRKETYYRIDTRLMYLETIDAIVKGRVEEVTSAKGIKLLSIKQYSPIFDDLYKPTFLKSAPPQTPADGVA